MARDIVESILAPFKAVINIFLDVFWTILSFPFMVWNKLPYSVKLGIFIFFIILGIIILIYAYKTRNEIYQIEP